ncbi:hypothetical protein H4CHR_04390 [Variovorax sp. PBS-H4]|uniref:hypothetical protein n=1 Tax=Variovorax sp. PBS-H4 TaxID=434008 RepID=UPI0013176C77|nr:hypothetical protein [Variovorax sp. PBS-H4]VTU38305.1 hypothetical protein H4CHR_04390 [Variovorax sp. PBS-H4]
MRPNPIALGVAIAYGFVEPHSTHRWSAAVFRQARRADLRTGYAGPNVSVRARLGLAFNRWLRGGPKP